MKRSSGDKQLGLASPLQSAASQSGRTNHPSENERAGCKSPHPHLSEGRGEVFFLDILFHRMSGIAIFRQFAPWLRAGGVAITAHHDVSSVTDWTRSFLCDQYVLPLRSAVSASCECRIP